MKFLNELLAKTSLQVILIVPFVLQIFGTVSIIGYLSFRNGQQTVNDLGKQLVEQLSDRVRHHTEEFLQQPHQVHQNIVSAINTRNLNPENLQQLQCYFLPLILQSNSTKDLGFGSVKGEFIGIDRRADNDRILLKIKNATGNNRNVYKIDSQCRQQELVSSKPYELRSRPWYLAGVTADRPTWSPIFLSASGTQLEFSAITPVYSLQKKLLGVINTELNLKQIDRFLQELTKDNGVKAFIIEKTGAIVASSNSTSSNNVKATIARQMVTQSSEPIVKVTASNLREKFGSFEKINTSELITFENNGKPIFTKIISLKEEFGLDWLLVVAVPESNFMAQVDANTYTTSVLCILALAASVGIGMAIARWLMQPIANLNNAAKQIASGNFPEAIAIERTQELGKLADSFNLMAAQLQASFNGLTAFNYTLSDNEKQLALYNQGLEAQVKERTQELARTLEQLQEAQKFTERTIDAIADPIFVKDEQHRWLMVNTAFCQLIGRQRQELLGKTDYDFFSKTEADIFWARDNLVLTRGIDDENEESFTDAIGVIHTISTKKSLLVDTSGRKVIVGSIRDITARKRVEIALRESEEKLQTFFRNAPTIVYIKDLDGRYTSINYEFEKVIKISQAEVLGKTDYDFLPQETAEKFRNNDRLALESEIAIRVEESLLLEDGWHTYFAIKFPLLDANNKAYATCGIFTDITVRKRAEKALSESEERFRAAFEQAAVGIVQTDINGKFSKINQKFADIVGYSAEELLDKYFVDITYPDDISLDRLEIQLLIAGDLKTFAREKRYVRKDKTLVWVNISVSLVRKINGQPDYLIGILQDISDRKQAEEALQTQSRQFQALLDNIPHIAWLKDDRYQFIAVNEPFARACAIHPDDIIGKTDFDVWQPEIAQKYQDDDREVIASQQSKKVEEAIIDESGQTVWIETIKTPIFDQFGEAIGTTGISMNITDRKQAEEAMRQKNEEITLALEKLQLAQTELIQSEKMAALGQLVAGIAHEINTPLGAIQASIGNIVNSLEESLQNLPQLFRKLSSEDLADFFTLLEIAQQPKQQLSFREERQLKRTLKQTLEDENIEQADVIADNLSKMGILPEQIPSLKSLLQTNDNSFTLETAYQLSAIQNNSQNIKLAVERASKIVFALKSYARQDFSESMVSASIADGIETVLTIYHNQLKQGINLVKTYEEVPSIPCYPEELTQVWTNLIHNALQAMNYKGKLTIALCQRDRHIVVEITDSGAGIPPEIQEKIFQPFFTTKPAGEGSGLGLDIVRKIVEKHQGKIELESQPGSTKFSVWLPIN
jgi:two-component system, NtrC family, sensor kinase